MTATDIYPKKLDWQRILKDIKEEGKTSLYMIAKRLGKPESTVQSWWRGHEPSHSNGQAILKIHSEVCGDEATKSRCTEESVYSAVR